MGSKKYPKENHFDSQLQSYGGDYNAFTDAESTTYYFSIPFEHVSEILDIFANFFIDPLFNPDSSTRELEMIESEFSLAGNEDETRLQQIWCETAKKGHPMSKFAWGNMRSLREIPQTLKVDPAKELLKFYNDYYVASNMKLCILSPHTLDELEQMVVTSFSGIERKRSLMIDSSSASLVKISEFNSTPDFFHFGFPFEDVIHDSHPEATKKVAKSLPSIPRYGYVTKIVPLRQKSKLVISWQMPSIIKKYKTRPHDIIAHLIGDEGNGSIISSLKNIGYATDLIAGIEADDGFENNSSCSMFSVAIDVTHKGIENWEEIVAIVFAYISVLQKLGPSKRVFDELKEIAAMNYAMSEDMDPDEFVENQSQLMLSRFNIDPSDLLIAHQLYLEWNPEEIKEFLDYFIPESVRVDMLMETLGTHSQWIGKSKHSESKDDTSSSNQSEFNSDEESEYDDDEQGDEDGEEDEGDDGDEESEDEAVDTGYNGDSYSPEVVEKINQRAEMLGLGNPRFEKHFGTLYWMDKISEETINLWKGALESASLFDGKDGEYFSFKSMPKQSSGSIDASHISKLGLPEKNTFIPQDFSLHEEQKMPSTASPLNTSHPSPMLLPKINDILTVYWLPDSQFRVPKTCIYFWFHSSKINSRPKNRVIADFCLALIDDYLNEQTYLAKMAELGHEIKTTEFGIELKFSGFSDKLWFLVELVLQQVLDVFTSRRENNFSLQSASATSKRNQKRSKGKERARNKNYDEKQEIKKPFAISQERIDSVLENLRKRYRNRCMSSETLAKRFRLHSILKQYWNEMDLEFSLSQMSDGKSNNYLLDFQSGAETLLSPCDVHMLVVGNVNMELMKQYQSRVLGMFQNQHIAPFRYNVKTNDDTNRQVVKLPLARISSLTDAGSSPSPTRAARIACIPSKGPEKNHAVHFYVQVGPHSVKYAILLDIIEQLMSEPIFDELRTKKSLGYDVSAFTTLTRNILGYQIVVVSAKYPPSYITEAIDDFLKHFLQYLEKMDEKTFRKYCNAVIDVKLEEDKNLVEVANRHWNTITGFNVKDNLTPNFNPYLEEIKLIEKATLSEVLEMYQALFFNSFVGIRALNVWVVGSEGGKVATLESESDKAMSNIISNIEATFQNTSSETGKKVASKVDVVRDAVVFKSKFKTWETTQLNIS